MQPILKSRRELEMMRQAGNLANAILQMQRSAVAPLEARRRVEAESRVVNEIDAALQALGAAGH